MEPCDKRPDATGEYAAKVYVMLKKTEETLHAQSAPGEPIPEDKEPPEPAQPAEKPKENP